MKREGQDEYDILKMGQVFHEPLMMDPHCVKKLLTARADLESFLENLQRMLLSVRYPNRVSPRSSLLPC